MDLEVVGRHVLFFDDDAMAAFVNSSDALVEWNSLQIDRYDVRHLISGSLPPRQPQNSRYSSHLSDSSLESELDHERYLDLHESSDNQEMEDAGNPEDSGGYHAVSFSYGNASDSANQKIADGALGYDGYQPPFAVPESLAQSLPSTEKEHQIIARTALFVSQHGGQSEIVLRVKQGDNPTFGFLMPDHHMHLYFRFLVDHPELLESNVKEKPQVSEKKVETASNSVIGGALTLLGSVYGDDEDGVEDSKSVGYEKTDNTTSHMDSHFSESSNDAEKEKIETMSKLPVSHHKERTSLLKRNPSLTASKAGHTSSMKKTDDPVSYLTSVKKSREPLIVEPPSDLKKLIDKIVEFIAKNGKQFEAALCEQDNEHLRFPFLLPSDQYHPYYLHVLQKAQESKGGTKNTLGNNDSGAGRGLSSGFVASDVASYEFDRKEKFKMVIGKSKKDVQDLPSKATTQQESGVTLDVAAAAAILKAATRGVKNPDLGTLPIPDNKNQKNNQAGGPNNSDPVGASVANASDSSEAHLTNEQKLKAERLRRAKMFVAMLKSGNELPRCSSVEPVEAAVGSIQMNANIPGGNAREGSSVPIDGSVLDGSEIFNRKYSVDEHKDRSKRKYRSRSDRNEDDSEKNNKDETELTQGGVSCDVDSDGKHRKEESHKRRRKKHHRSHRRLHRDDSTGSSDTEAGYRKYSKKKKHSSHPSSSVEGDDDERYNSSKYYHKRKSHRHSHEYDYSSSDTDISSDKRRSNKKHHSSHRSSREDGDDFEHDNDDKYHKHSKKKHRSHRSSHRKHEKSDSSRDKEQEPSLGDAGKHDNSRYEEERKGSDSVKEDLEEGEISSKVAEHHDTRGVICNESLKDKSNATQRSQSADVPDDLRAKIRAMLLATR